MRTLKCFIEEMDLDMDFKYKEFYVIASLYSLCRWVLSHEKDIRKVNLANKELFQQNPIAEVTEIFWKQK